VQYTTTACKVLAKELIFAENPLAELTCTLLSVLYGKEVISYAVRGH
jgi:hypothetical protein